MSLVIICIEKREYMSVPIKDYYDYNHGFRIIECRLLCIVVIVVESSYKLAIYFPCQLYRLKKYTRIVKNKIIELE